MTASKAVRLTDDEIQMLLDSLNSVGWGASEYLGKQAEKLKTKLKTALSTALSAQMED